MSKVRFFDFGNSETYNFFRWVQNGGQLNVAALIAAAFDRVDGDEDYQFFGDVFRTARRKLAERLQDVLEDEAADLDVHWEPLWDPHSSFRALTNAFLAAALHSIDLEAVAEALLIDAGKWAPDNSIPEII